MSEYFSFQKCITSPFVKTVYFLGFLVLTAGGIGLMAWAAMRLYEANIARGLGWYYAAVGAGIVLVGNLVWRVFCEIWIVLFNIHARLVSLDQKSGTETLVTELRTDVSREAQREEILRHREMDLSSHLGSVLGLSS